MASAAAGGDGDGHKSPFKLPKASGRNFVRKSAKGKWTKEEDECLKRLVVKYKGSDWKAIAAEMPNRSHGQCVHRWSKVLNPELVKGAWTAEEDDIIRSKVDELGPKRWSAIAKFVPGRLGKQCRERWLNHLDPSIKKGKWTQKEDDQVLKLHAMVGNKWANIAKHVDGRTDNMIKNRWNSTLKRSVIAQYGCVPPPTDPFALSGSGGKKGKGKARDPGPASERTKRTRAVRSRSATRRCSEGASPLNDGPLVDDNTRASKRSRTTTPTTATSSTTARRRSSSNNGSGGRRSSPASGRRGAQSPTAGLVESLTRHQGDENTIHANGTASSASTGVAADVSGLHVLAAASPSRSGRPHTPRRFPVDQRTQLQQLLQTPQAARRAATSRSCRSGGGGEGGEGNTGGNGDATAATGGATLEPHANGTTPGDTTTMASSSSVSSSASLYDTRFVGGGTVSAMPVAPGTPSAPWRTGAGGAPGSVTRFMGVDHSYMPMAMTGALLSSAQPMTPPVAHNRGSGSGRARMGQSRSRTLCFDGQDGSALADDASRALAAVATDTLHTDPSVGGTPPRRGVNGRGGGGGSARGGRGSDGDTNGAHRGGQQRMQTDFPPLNREPVVAGVPTPRRSPRRPFQALTTNGAARSPMERTATAMGGALKERTTTTTTTNSALIDASAPTSSATGTGTGSHVQPFPLVHGQGFPYALGANGTPTTFVSGPGGTLSLTEAPSSSAHHLHPQHMSGFPMTATHPLSPAGLPLMGITPMAVVQPQHHHQHQLTHQLTQQQQQQQQQQHHQPHQLSQSVFMSASGHHSHVSGNGSDAVSALLPSPWRNMVNLTPVAKADTPAAHGELLALVHEGRDMVAQEHTASLVRTGTWTAELGTTRMMTTSLRVVNERMQAASARSDGSGSSSHAEAASVAHRRRRLVMGMHDGVEPVTPIRIPQTDEQQQLELRQQQQQQQQQQHHQQHHHHHQQHHQHEVYHQPRYGQQQPQQQLSENDPNGMLSITSRFGVSPPRRRVPSFAGKVNVRCLATPGSLSTQAIQRLQQTAEDYSELHASALKVLSSPRRPLSTRKGTVS